MKLKIYSYLTVLLAVFMAGCEYDNYEPPKSTLTGQIVHNGEPIGVRSNAVRLELRQPGPEYPLWKTTPININIAQDGTFSAVLFDGNYKLTRVRGNGPWADQNDTINVEVRGSSMVEVPVDPFFIIKNAAIKKGTSTIDATFNLQQVNTTRQLERVNLYVSSTNIVDATNQRASAQKVAADINGLNAPVTLSVNISSLPAAVAGKQYVFARVGVKTVGIQELAYSAPIKIQLK
ncbi:DUF3823 domain-containing protein [Adhaeribacter rhizoryzae]|uniref:DUF3823 domain-containing protein n=1 Tax=Adhaeribacter rhizoryzae TaxID=2607907 RepID=A0A5M6D3T0_9BACT|nr:DUF3823 domain-containing protein [Adhaeribacter rhizoryzae]KAA5541250.1 DUF3823 domain-containing protein [Adhaeribacter rhizoryzae]